VVESAVAEARFRRLYDDHHRQILAYFLRRTDRDTAYDCTEDVFLVAWRKLDEVPTGQAALAWLYGVSWRVLANHRRKIVHERELGHLIESGAATPDSGPDCQVVRREEYAELLEAVTELSDRDREVLRLAVWEELPHAQIADVLGCSVNAVNVRLHRALRRLAKGLRQRRHITGRGRPAFTGGQ
jgi:RNA polymerase sigma-70 factor (ECF subfamily)